MDEHEIPQRLARVEEQVSFVRDGLNALNASTHRLQADVRDLTFQVYEMKSSIAGMKVRVATIAIILTSLLNAALFTIGRAFF